MICISPNKDSINCIFSFVLFIQVYRALMDAVVLDWTISLADKDKMKTCAVTYLAKEANESTTIDPFMPRTRTFLLEHLHTGQVRLIRK